VKAIIKGGAFAVARKITSSEIWSRPLLYMKVWLYLLAEAAYEPTVMHGVKVERGQLFTTYAWLANALSWTENRRTVRPGKKALRLILKWMANAGMIRILPITSAQKVPNWGTNQGQTGARPGLLISIEKYDVYQDWNNYRGTNQGTDPTELGHIYKEGKKDKRKEVLETSSQSPQKQHKRRTSDVEFT
jgi:hypothetical protein